MTKIGFLINILISVLISFPHVEAFAQEIPPEVPQVETEFTDPILQEGQPIRWRWSNGRQAILVETLGDVRDFEVGLTMTKNTCNQAPAPNCSLKSRIRQRVVAKVWEEYPGQPEMIGTLLKQNRSNEDRYQDEESDPEKFHVLSYLITSLGQMQWKSLGLKTYNFPEVEDILVCDNFEWLPKSDSGKVLIDSWMTSFEDLSSELQMVNVNITATVNQFVTAAHGVELEKKNSTEFKIEKVRTTGSTASSFSDATLSLGYMTIMNFDRNRTGVKPQASQDRIEWSDPQCRIEMTLNFSELFTKFSALIVKDFPRPTAKNSHPVLFNRTDPLIYMNPNGFIRGSVSQ